MSRYIDANKLVEILNETQDDINPNDYYKGLGLAKIIVDETPTEDVKPIKHARWAEIDGEFHCTNCGAILERDMWMWNNFRYCYHCGARMEGGSYNCGAKMEEEK